MVVIVGISLSLFSNDVWGENLVKSGYDEHSGTVFYYDKDSVKRISGKVKLWEKIYWGGEELSKRVELLGKMSVEGNQKLSYSKYLVEINCKEKTFSYIVYIDYDEKGGVLYLDKPSEEILNIVPNTVIDWLKKHVCW
jgi:hypothetical protein